MSGIAGYWSYAARDIPTALFADFTDSLAHRGPDGCGIDHFPDVRLWLGHRRLATVARTNDPRQPLADAKRRYWLTYDGAIYNDRALRDELRGLGHRFMSAATGEVILAAYAQWGENCLARFNGMWALAIWDSRDRRLFLARDNFGIKPLHYAQRGGAVAFASELKAFLRLPWVDGAFDPEILIATLGNLDDQEATPPTLLPGVERLAAGHALIVEASGETRHIAWWNMLDRLPVPAADLSGQADAFRALLLDASKVCLRSDAPLAIEQSGGLDSSAIACSIAVLDRRAARRPSGDPRQAFVACFAATRHNEYSNARMVADHAGMALHRVDIDDRQARDVIDQVIFDHENIFGFPRIGAWMLYRAMRDAGIRVSLAGIGIDDVLGSDTDYVEAALDAALQRLDLRRYRGLRRVLRAMAGGNVDIGRATAWGEVRWLLRGAIAHLRLLESMRKIRGGRDDDALLRSPARSRRGRDDIVTTPGAASLNGKRYRDFQRVTPLYLANFDRASSAHGIETRMPFMDRRLVSYGFALPEPSRNGGGQTKRVLRLAMTGMMPDPIRLRTRKTAFTVPLDDWARGALKPWLLDLCASRTFLDSDIWHGPTVRRIVERAVAGEASLHPVWPILQSHVLERAFIARAREDVASPQEQDMVLL
jgi:asparagine synthase (glutamine-hydrolysing)